MNSEFEWLIVVGVGLAVARSFWIIVIALWRASLLTNLPNTPIPELKRDTNGKPVSFEYGNPHLLWVRANFQSGEIQISAKHADWNFSTKSDCKAGAECKMPLMLSWVRIKLTRTSSEPTEVFKLTLYFDDPSVKGGYSGSLRRAGKNRFSVTLRERFTELSINALQTRLNPLMNELDTQDKELFEHRMKTEEIAK